MRSLAFSLLIWLLATSTAAAAQLDGPYRRMIEQAAAAEDEDGFRYLINLMMGLPDISHADIFDTVSAFAPDYVLLTRDVLGMPAPNEVVAEMVAEGETEVTSETVAERLAEGPGSLLREAREGWSGRLAVGLSIDVAEESDSELDIKLDLRRQAGPWNLTTLAEYARDATEKVETENDLFINLRGERDWRDNWTFYGYTEYEDDQFSSYELDWWVAGGLGYRLVDRESMHWILRGGVGVRAYEPVTADEVQTVGGLDLNSQFDWQVFPWLLFRSDSLFQVSDNGQADQRFRLISNFTDDWAIQLSYRYKYDFEPTTGLEPNKTEIDLSVVRNF